MRVNGSTPTSAIGPPASAENQAGGQSPSETSIKLRGCQQSKIISTVRDNRTSWRGILFPRCLYNDLVYRCHELWLRLTGSGNHSVNIHLSNLITICRSGSFPRRIKQLRMKHESQLLFRIHLLFAVFQRFSRITVTVA